MTITFIYYFLLPGNSLGIGSCFCLFKVYFQIWHCFVGFWQGNGWFNVNGKKIRVRICTVIRHMWTRRVWWHLWTIFKLSPDTFHVRWSFMLTAHPSKPECCHALNVWISIHERIDDKFLHTNWHPREYFVENLLGLFCKVN